MRYIHLDLCSVPAFGDCAFFRYVQIHTEYRSNTHLEHLVLGQDMQRRISQRQVRHGCYPLCAMLVAVTVIYGQCVHLEGIILHIELQIIALAA